jgi:hypothetical protein
VVVVVVVEGVVVVVVVVDCDAVVDPLEWPRAVTVAEVVVVTTATAA